MTERPANHPPVKPHRIDDAHPGASGHINDRRVSEPSTSNVPTEICRIAELEALLPHHATDLIYELQAWADRLDRREAELNARLAMLEHNSRTSRLKDQNDRVARDEQERSLARRREAFKNHLRRLAIGNITPQH